MEQKRPKKGEHFNSKYPEKFKRKVIEEYLRTGCTKMDLVRKYKIRSKSGITSWMQELGYEDINRKMYYFEVLNRATLMAGKKSKKQKPPVSEQTALLEKIKLLELKLEEEKLRSEMFSRMVEIAEKDLNIPIRKKYNTK
jgi:transposase-like protein